MPLFSVLVPGLRRDDVWIPWSHCHSQGNDGKGSQAGMKKGFCKSIKSAKSRHTVEGRYPEHNKLLDSPVSSTGQAQSRALLEYDPAYAGRNDIK